jgi:hypothetical protein
MMERSDYKKIIKEPNGIFTYTFFSYYMFDRVIGTKNYIAWDGGRSPYYKLNEEGKATYVGSFNDRFILTSLFKYIASNSLLNYLIKDLPRVNKKDVVLVAAIFEKMNRIYKRDFPQGKFVVIVNNSVYTPPRWQTALLVDELHRRNVAVEVIEDNNIFHDKVFFDAHINAPGQVLQAQTYLKLLGRYL